MDSDILLLVQRICKSHITNVSMLTFKTTYFLEFYTAENCMKESQFDQKTLHLKDLQRSSSKRHA